MSEQERVERFEAAVKKQIKLLSSPDAAVRRKAAAWLGEAGDPQAITRLKQVYEDDEDPGVRAAAAYALSMFRALEEALASEKRQPKAMKLLEDIVHKGRMGRRTRIPGGCLRQLAAGLATSLLILLAFNFVIWPYLLDPNAPPPAAPTASAPTAAPEAGEAAEETSAPTAAPTAAPTPTPAPRLDPLVAPHIAALYAVIDEVRGPRGAASALEQYWSDVRSAGTTGGCTQPLPAIPANYELPEDAAAASPELDLAKNLVNTGLGLLRLGWDQFQAACAAGLAAGLNDGLRSVDNIKAAFSTAASQLDALRGQ